MISFYKEPKLYFFLIDTNWRLILYIVETDFEV